MKLSFSNGVRGLPLLLSLATSATLACDPALNGCLGCNDDQLKACLDRFVMEICESSGSPGSCDVERVYDDAERYVLTSTGSHMSRIRSMVRSARKYRAR